MVPLYIDFRYVKKHRDKGFYKFSNDEYAEVYLQKDEKDLVFQILITKLVLKIK